MSYKTTKKDFQEFKKEAEKWIEYFGLKDWEVRFFHKDIDCRADVHFNMNSRIANIRLGSKWKDSPERYEIRGCGFHEVCELLLAPLTDIVQDYIVMNENDRRVHNVIRRLENTIFKGSL